MNKHCYIMVGVSGSGKSTVMWDMINHFPQMWDMILKTVEQTYSIFSLDMCRLDFLDEISDDPKVAYARAFDKANNNKSEFNAFVDKVWKQALESEVVFVDNTNLTKKSRARWIQDARKKGFKIVAVNVMSPLQTVLDRQATRKDKSVPAEVVRDMYMRMQEVQADEADYIMNIDGTK